MYRQELSLVAGRHVDKQGQEQIGIRYATFEIISAAGQSEIASVETISKSCNMCTIMVGIT